MNMLDFLDIEEDELDDNIDEDEENFELPMKVSRFHKKEIKEISTTIREKAKQWGEDNFEEGKFSRKELSVLTCFVMSLLEEGVLCRASN